MTLLEKLKGLFTRDEIPDEAKSIFEKAKSPAELLKGLDGLLTRNEIEAKELNLEITKIEEQCADEEGKIRDGSLPERLKRSALLLVKRLRKQMENYEGRLRIYERNMNLHLNLIGMIQQMEAMKLGGVDEEKIDQIVMDFEEKRERYSGLMTAAEANERAAVSLSAKEDRELRDLEAEILGTKKEPAAKEAPAAAPARKPETVVREAPPAERAPLPRRPIDDEIDKAIADEEAKLVAERADLGRPSNKKKLELE